jgi:hypothetical protein
MQIAKTAELTKERVKQLKNENDNVTVAELKQDKYRSRSGKQRQKFQASGKQLSTTTASRDKYDCRRCGNRHESRKCPAYGTECAKCGKANHWAIVCKSKMEAPRQHEQRYHGNQANRSRGNRRSSRYNVHEVEYDNEDSDEHQYEIDTVEVGNNKEEIHTTLSINGRQTEVKIDTGARINVMSVSTKNDISPKALIDTNKTIRIKAFGGDSFDTMGTVNLQCEHDKVVYHITFHVVDRQVTTLLGLPDTMKLNIIQLSKEVYQVLPEKHAPEIDEYRDVFDDKIGELPVQYKMKINTEATPVVKPPRKIPLAMKAAVKEELDRMEKLEVISKIEEPTEWVSSMVAAKKKSGEIRICIDPRDLNKVLQRPHHPMKTIDEVIRDIPNAKVFSIMDAKSGFWQIPLEEESKLLTAFNTPFGRYIFNRMPYGLNSGSEVFQRAMEQLFSGYPCEIIVDDILVWGTTEEEHDKKLKKVLDRVRKINMKLNKKKCRFRVHEVAYVGHLLTSDGVVPDPNKITAIAKMPAPENQQALQRVLGMFNYLSKFIPDYSELTAPLRTLLHKDTEWCWLDQHQKAFEKLKGTLASPPVLQYYDVNKPVTLTCDASKSGIGAACMQNDRPVAYASRAMTETEQRYAQIEKELLAVTFACKKFHDYIYGKRVMVETDHQPLITILKKPIHAAPARLQKMIMQLQRYNIDLVYRPGKELYVADTLSRAYITDPEPQTDDWYEVMCVLPVSQRRKQQLQQETAADEVCRQLQQTINEGWPENYKDATPNIRQFYAFRDELVVQEGILMKGTRVVVPAKLQPEYLAELHKGHPGVEATKARARECVYWHNISKDIENTVASCKTCNALKPKQQKEPLQSYETPKLPYQIVATDVFEHQRQMYMVTVDSYSGYYDIDKLHDTTSATIILKLKKQFATHGIPETLISDNATYYTSKEFRQFKNEWQFQHVTSSPLYPQSNGLAERAVRSAKGLLKKCSSDKIDPYMALLHVRNTPRGQLASSAQRLYSRRTRTTLPMVDELLKPAIVKNVTTTLKNIRTQKKAYYDKTSKPLPTLQPSDVVRMQTTNGFEHLATVVRKTNRPRSYVVETDGRLYERNRRHLLKVNEKRMEKERMETIYPAIQPTATEPTTTQPAPDQPRIIQPVLATPPVAEQPAVVTRSGRVVKPNPKYRD